jgi:hypothetical protein
MKFFIKSASGDDPLKVAPQIKQFVMAPVNQVATLTPEYIAGFAARLNMTPELFMEVERISLQYTWDNENGVWSQTVLKGYVIDIPDLESLLTLGAIVIDGSMPEFENTITLYDDYLE